VCHNYRFRIGLSVHISGWRARIGHFNLRKKEMRKEWMVSSCWTWGAGVDWLSAGLLVAFMRRWQVLVTDPTGALNIVLDALLLFQHGLWRCCCSVDIVVVGESWQLLMELSKTFILIDWLIDWLAPSVNWLFSGSAMTTTVDDIEWRWVGLSYWP